MSLCSFIDNISKSVFERKNRVNVVRCWYKVSSAAKAVSEHHGHQFVQLVGTCVFLQSLQAVSRSARQIMWR